MKKLTKRILSFVVVLTLILSLSTLFSGCYLTRSGKMSQIEGIYELTSYSGKSNYMEERGVKILLLIRSDGTGWYGYQTNTSEPYITELRCRFVQDTEEPGKYNHVEIDFAGNGEYVNFGIFADLSSSTLNSSRAVWGANPFKDGIEYYITSTFKRIDKSTDLEKLKELFGDCPVMPRGAMRYDGTYEGFGPVATDKSPSPSAPEDPFVYCFVDIDLLNGKGKIWYMLKSNEEAIVEEFSVSIASTISNGLMIKLGETEVKVEGSSYSSYMYLPYITDEGEFAIQVALRGYYTEEEIGQTIDEIYKNYLAAKPVE